MGVPNEEQRKRWDEEEGHHWVEEAERFDRMLEPYGERVIAALSPEPGERILDIGCGNGALSLDVAARVGPQGSVVGLDLSGPMLSLARSRAGERGLGNVTFEQSDVQVHDFGDDRSFDAVMSRFGVMFFEDPVAAFANLRSAVRGGGRMAFACWQSVFENDWLTVPAAAILQFVPMPEPPAPGTPGPFGLADPDQTRSCLTDAGWQNVDLEGFEIRQWLGPDPAAVVEFLRKTEIAKSMLGEADEETAAKAWTAVESLLAEHTDHDGVHLTGRAWLVTATNP